MLNEREKALAKELLDLISPDDLASLASTSSNNMIIVNNSQDAINAILGCTENFSALLHRKKVYKEIIFKYLHSKNVPVNPSTEKSLLMKELLNYWNTQLHTAFQVKEERPKGSVSNPSPRTADVSSNVSTNNNEIHQMARMFVKWYYSMSNESQQSGAESGTFGAGHFWQDCNLKLVIIAGEEQQVKEVEKNAREVVNELLTFQRQNHLLFNPNIDETRGMGDPHGLVRIISCGTLHQPSTCVGVFEQMFGLIRDPFSDNNWKIKFTELHLRRAEQQKTLENG